MQPFMDIAIWTNARGCVNHVGISTDMGVPEPKKYTKAQGGTLKVSPIHFHSEFMKT